MCTLRFIAAVFIILDSILGQCTHKPNTHNVTILEGSTVPLNCTGKCELGTWRGSFNNNESIQLPYFEGHRKNPNLTVQNIRLECNTTYYKYDMVIVNATAQNQGVYICQVLDKINISKYCQHSYRVKVQPTSTDEFSSYFDTTFIPVYTGAPSDTNDTSESKIMIPFFVVGILTVMITIVIFGRICYGDTIQEIWNRCISVVREQSEDHGDEEAIHSDAVQNQLYQTTGLINAHFELPDQESSVSDTSIFQQNDRATLNQDPIQVLDTGLHYSEVMIEPGTSSQMSQIRGINDRTIYSDIDHSLIGIPLDETESENSSEGDFMDVNDMDFSRDIK